MFFHSTENSADTNQLFSGVKSTNITNTGVTSFCFQELEDTSNNVVRVND